MGWNPAPGYPAGVVWANISGYMSSASFRVNSLYLNGTRYQQARWPNLLSPDVTTGRAAEFARTSNAASTKSGSIQSMALTQPNGAWIGAFLRIRTQNWYYETRTVTDSYAAVGTTPGNLTLSSPLTKTPADGTGFYLEGAAAAFDLEGEFYYKPEARQLFVWPYSSRQTVTTAGGLYSATNVRIGLDWSSRGITFNSGVNNVVVRDLAFEDWASAGIYCGGPITDVVLDSLTINDIKDGISCYGATNLIVQNSDFSEYVS